MAEPVRILVVDDTEANRYAVARHLRHAGYTVWEAADGRSALTQLADRTPDLLIVDIRMPGMDGFEMVRRLRAERRTAHLPVLHVSASFTDPLSQAEGLDSGADGYLTHPVEPVVLLASVRALLRARSAEREAKAAEAAWRATFEAIGDGVCVVDSSGRILRHNAALESIVGRAELHGRALPELMPMLASAAEPPYLVSADGRALVGTELTFDGRRLLVSCRSMPNGDGGMHQAVCVMTDVSRQRAAEVRLQQAQRLEAAGQLAGGIAHEINNMMTVVLGLAEFMVRSGELSGPHHRDMGEISKAATRAAEMARQLLAFTRRQVLHPTLLDLNATLAAMGRLIRQLMGANREVAFHLAPDAGLVFADQGQLEQVILNLALNARDAMPRGGHFSVSTSLERLDGNFAAQHPGIEIRQGEYARITVADTGSGMDAETLQRAFEPFYTTKPVGEGTGLGLATVYGIIKQSNGYVWAESVQDGGAKFHIYLPQVPGRVGGAGAQQPAVPLHRGNAGILVVDDEPMIRALARRALELYGYEVLEAEDGEAALEVVRSDAGARVALALVDVVMPGMDGRELSELLRRERPGIGVLYISGHTGDELARRLLLEASVPFLQKPFPPDELVERVQELLELRTQGHNA
ncbi:MAG TPA: response regulator [Gemmatimonadales bacterium]|nr:response regulator [Gemmatimonadales bacterium]